VVLPPADHPAGSGQVIPRRLRQVATNDERAWIEAETLQRRREVRQGCHGTFLGREACAGRIADLAPLLQRRVPAPAFRCASGARRPKDRQGASGSEVGHAAIGAGPCHCVGSTGFLCPALGIIDNTGICRGARAATQDTTWSLSDSTNKVSACRFGAANRFLIVLALRTRSMNDRRSCPCDRRHRAAPVGGVARVPAIITDNNDYREFRVRIVRRRSGLAMHDRGPRRSAPPRWRGAAR